MVAGLIAGAAALALQLPPSVLDPNGDQLFILQARPAVACLDRYFGSPGAEAHSRELVGTMLSPARPADRGEAEHPPEVGACLRMVPVGTQEYAIASLYAETRRLLPGLRERLAASSVDLAALQRLARTPEMGRVVAMGRTAGDAEFRRLLGSAGVPSAEGPIAGAYILLNIAAPMLDASTHPPARPARHIAGRIGGEDYPDGAMARGRQGRVLIAFTITELGAVSNCQVHLSSGYPVLDERSCALVTQRFRFEPALDEAGRPVAQSGFRGIEWRIP